MVSLKFKSCFQGVLQGEFIQLKSFAANTSSNAFTTGIFLFYKSQIPRKQFDFRSGNECNDDVYVINKFQEIA